MLKKILLLGAVAAGIGMPVFADQLTPSQAFLRAKGIPDKMMKAPFEAVPVATGSSDGLNTYYVFDNGSTDGFVVVSADDATPIALLGYCDNGTFDKNNMPPALSELLDSYSKEIAWMASHGASASRHKVAQTLKHDVAPIVETKWGQDAPFNDMCPKVGSNTTYVGCVATAMSQIMKVHNWPASGRGKMTYLVPTLGSRLTVDFSESVYDWSSMSDEYNSFSSAAKKEAVARLCYDCGVSVRMEYGVESSGAASEYVGEALYTYFDYDAGIEHIDRNFYYLDQWVDLLYGEIEQGRPVYFAGSTYSRAGHAFVIDGFRAADDMFHVNWGWKGMSDGYFRISALDPSVQGIGGADAGFNVRQNAWIGIRPPVEGSKPKASIRAKTPFTVASKSYTRSSSTQNVSFFGTPYSVMCYAPMPITCETGVQLTDESNGEVSYVESTGGQRQFSSLSGDASIRVRVNKFPENGTYIVKPAYKYEDKWYEMPQQVTGIQTSLRLTATPGNLKFEDMSPAGKIVIDEVSLPDTVYSNTMVRALLALRSEGSPAYTHLKLSLTNLSNTRTYATLSQKVFDFAENEDTEADVSGFLNAIDAIPDGTECLLVVSRSNGDILNNLEWVDIESKNVIYAKNEPVWNVASFKFDGNGSGSMFSPYSFAIDNFRITANIKCSEGLLSDNVSGIFVSSAGYVIGTTSRTPVSVKAGESAEVIIEGNMTDQIQTGVSYRFTVVADNTSTDNSNIYWRYARATRSGIGSVESDDATFSVSSDNGLLTVNAESSVDCVEVYTVNGCSALTVSGNGSDTVTADISSLGAGIYLVRVTTADGVFTRRIVR